MKPSAQQTAVTPDDAGDVGVPIGLLLVLTFSADHDLNNRNDFDRLYVGVTGDVTIKNTAGVATTFKAAPVGMLNTAGKRVRATGTAATNMVAIKD